jgi:homocysteine S-methyltransferase
MPVGEAIEQVDEATGGWTAWFMLNCAHPEHMLAGLPDDGPEWLGRIGALRCNASRLSHAELDEAEELDSGDPADFAGAFRNLRERLPSARVIGGCCGTDFRHIEAAVGG